MKMQSRSEETDVPPSYASVIGSDTDPFLISAGLYQFVRITENQELPFNAANRIGSFRIVPEVVQHQNRSETEIPPPSYASVTGTDPASRSISPGLDKFVRIVEHHEKLHFYATNGMSSCLPKVVQIRDSSEQPILCIVTGRVCSSLTPYREIITPSGEVLISITPGTIQTLSAGDQTLGTLEDENLFCRQTLKARNTFGDVIFVGTGDHYMGDSDYSCFLECGFGFCSPNSTKFDFSNRGVILGELTRSESNSSGNELELFNSADIGPKTKALLLYASYSTYLTFFVDTKCGRIGDRGAARSICIRLVIVSVILACITLLILL